MFCLKNDKSITIARIEISGSCSGPESNRAMLNWLQQCPLPDCIQLSIAGDPVSVGRLFMCFDSHSICGDVPADKLTKEVI